MFQAFGPLLVDMAVCSLGVPDLSILILPTPKLGRSGKPAMTAQNKYIGLQTKAKNLSVRVFFLGGHRIVALFSN
jgi:hypothetical protein